MENSCDLLDEIFHFKEATVCLSGVDLFWFSLSKKHENETYHEMKYEYRREMREWEKAEIIWSKQWKKLAKICARENQIFIVDNFSLCYKFTEFVN